MKKMKKLFLALLLIFGVFCAVTDAAAEAETAGENAAMPVAAATEMQTETKAVPALGAGRADGYFQNTRKVLLLSPCGANAYIESRMEKELRAIFRYPYYQIIAEKAAPVSDTLAEAAKESGADIVVLPVVLAFTQFRHPGSMLWDSDPIVLTSAQLRLDWWETGMEAPMTTEARFFDRKPEGFDTDPDRIFDDMWKQMMKKFPYRRIPTDIAGKEAKGEAA